MRDIIKKYKYKIWKHLSKEFDKNKFLKVESIRSANTSQNSDIVVDTRSSSPNHNKLDQGVLRASPASDSPKPVPTIPPDHTICETTIEKAPNTTPKIVAIQGLLYSGSSTLVGMFQEFDNMRVVGYSEPAWTKTGTKMGQSECKFFSESGFIEMVKSFGKEGAELVSARIRKFILCSNEAFKNKRINPCENLPNLYGNTFKSITQTLLLNILDLDDYTREFMKERNFPHVAWETDEFPFDACNFTLGKGKRRYLSYKFANISEKEFHHYVQQFLEKFLSIIDGSEYIVYDQFLPWKSLEVVNKFLQTPIKQIVVIRDPRDQYLSADRRVATINMLPRTASLFRENVVRRLGGYPSDNPHRLILRFEDIVLKYEETKKKIMDFLGLKQQNHVAPKSVFDPSISVANIGAYRKYHRQEFMKEIEKELGEYCFYPEKENLSDEAIRLLISGGNWDDKFCVANN